VASALRLSPHFPQGPTQQRTFLLSKGLNDSDVQVFRLILQKTVGRQEPVPTVALSFSDVARMAGVSRPTVIRSFKRLKTAKLIHTTRKMEDHYHAGQQVGLCPELLAPAIGVKSWRCDTNQTFTIHCGDALEVLATLSDESVNCCVTSPPFFRQRDYDIDGQIGQEETPRQFISQLVGVFKEVRRVLRKD
jgi:DNA-binding Lrp family transcriptional regulator